MIKISKICDKNKNEFYDDVKKSYLDLLEKIKKDEKDTYNIKNRNKIIDYFYEGDKICENKVIEVITGDRKVLEKVIKEIGVLEKNKDDKKLHEKFESIYNNFTNREFGRTWGTKTISYNIQSSRSSTVAYSPKPAERVCKGNTRSPS